MPVLTATGAGVRQHRRWLFRDLDVSAEAGELLAVVGVPGSGRTTVLLALAQRFKLSAGRVELTGRAALGYVPDVEQPEPVFSVAEHVKERLALLGRSGREAGGVGLYGLDPTLKGWQLTPYQRHLLGLALARLAQPAVIVLDGVDEGLNAAERDRLWQILGELTADGVVVVVTARELEADRAATMIQLGDPQEKAGNPREEPGDPQEKPGDLQEQPGDPQKQPGDPEETE